MTITENNVAAQAGDEPMRKALQVCVKALEFRKERSANDEFALNLARIALAKSPRATADVERDSAKLKAAIIATLEAHTREMEGYSYFGSNPGVPEDAYEEIAEEILATTKHR